MGQGGRGFVQDRHRRGLHHGLSDFHQLLIADGKVPYNCIGVDFYAKLLKNLKCMLTVEYLINEPVRFWLPPQKQILYNGHCRDQGEFLIYHGNVVLLGIQGLLDLDFLSCNIGLQCDTFELT